MSIPPPSCCRKRFLSGSMHWKNSSNQSRHPLFLVCNMVKLSLQNKMSHSLQQSVAQVPKYMCETTLSDHTECYIFADPNYDLHTSNSSFSLWETFANLWKPTVPKIDKLPNTLSEAKEVASILADRPEFKVHVVTGDDATVTRLMKLESPFILHIST